MNTQGRSDTELEMPQNEIDSNPGADSKGPLPDGVTYVQLQDKEVYLIGTAHVSRRSVDDVRSAIEILRPETVCLELDETRYRNLIDPHRWKTTNIGEIIRKGQSLLLLSSLIMSSFQRRIGKKLGIQPGAELAQAVESARQIDARLILADRDIQVTLKRTWANLNFADKLKMVSQLVASLFVDEDIDEATIEELKSEEKLADVLELMAREFPLIKQPLLDERDLYLAQKIRQAPGRRIVAVVGAGHVSGILKEITTDQPLTLVETVPQAALWPRILKWGIPALIIGLLIYGFWRGGSQHSLESIYIWFLINGGLSALGAALAFGHPLTILSAFLAAPLTSLNPMIAAGWVSGLVQAFVKKPTVQDLEELPEAITAVKGFWLNPASRVLLVVVLSNLGSVAGTFIAGSWIAVRTVS